MSGPGRALISSWYPPIGAVQFLQKNAPSALSVPQTGNSSFLPQCVLAAKAGVFKGLIRPAPDRDRVKKTGKMRPCGQGYENS